LLGIALVIGAATCFATMDTTVRYVGAFFSVAVVLWVRYALHAVAMTTWIALSSDKTFRTANPLFQIARGALLAFSSAMAFAALRRMPVAEFTAIVMLTPLAATLLARVWLHERISRLRWSLVVGGFVGALIVIRPGSGAIGWAALLPLAAASSNAAFQILTSRYAPQENPFTTNFYTGATGMAIATPILLASVADPIEALAAAPTLHLAALAAVAALGTTGHLLLIMALGQGAGVHADALPVHADRRGRAGRLARLRRHAGRLGLGRHGRHRRVRRRHGVVEHARRRRTPAPCDAGGCRHRGGLSPGPAA
jgi:drug/metabolite transporter (DMT)-like permease